MDIDPVHHLLKYKYASIRSVKVLKDNLEEQKSTASIHSEIINNSATLTSTFPKFEIVITLLLLILMYILTLDSPK